MCIRIAYVCFLERAKYENAKSFFGNTILPFCKIIIFLLIQILKTKSQKKSIIQVGIVYGAKTIEEDNFKLFIPKLKS